MPAATANGIEIYYEMVGDPADPPMLLISGLGMQLVGWDRRLFDLLAGEGFYVIAHDNRDVGLSTQFGDQGTPDLVALLSGGEANIPYSIPDMAADAAGLLEAIGIDACHVVGVSMGGMIAQQLAIDFPEKVSSLCSIMSTTGAPDVGHPSEQAAAALLVPAPRTKEEAMGLAVEVSMILGTPAFPIDVERTRELAGEAWERSSDSTGVARQLGAILTAPDRTAALGAVSVPTLVIHGDADPLVDVSGGRATAAAIPGSKLVVVEEMGHALPSQLWEWTVEEIVTNARSAQPASPAPSR